MVLEELKAAGLERLREKERYERAAWPPIPARPMLVTPALASEWLERSGYAVNQANVEAYRREMEAGEWRATDVLPVTIHYARNVFVVADGRHRLTAVVRLGRPVTMLIYMIP
jgi:hypothetical protein